MRTHRPSGTRTGALALIIALALAACSGDDAASTARTPRAADATPFGAELHSLQRGDYVPEIEESPTATTPNRHYTCGECAGWGALPESERQALVDTFMAATLPAGFNPGSHIIHVVVPTRLEGDAQDDDLTVDVLDEVTGAEFRFVAIPDLQALVLADGTTDSSSGAGPPVGALVEVDNQRRFRWDAGETVHELHAPDGAIYVLYLLTLGGEIGSLADDLVLADGWTYAPRALTEPLVVDSGGSSPVYTGLGDRHLWQRL